MRCCGARRLSLSVGDSVIGGFTRRSDAWASRLITSASSDVSGKPTGLRSNAVDFRVCRCRACEQAMPADQGPVFADKTFD